MVYKRFLEETRSLRRAGDDNSCPLNVRRCFLLSVDYKTQKFLEGPH